MEAARCTLCSTEKTTKSKNKCFMANAFFLACKTSEENIKLATRRASGDTGSNIFSSLKYRLAILYNLL
jgi:hypothetical protein